MKKPPAKNNKPKRHSKFITWKRLLMALGVVVLLVAGLIAYWAYSYNTAQDKQFAIDKQHFAQADTDMQQAYNAIVQSVGPPYEMKETKSCGYGAQEWTLGPLSCGITYRFVYEITDNAQGKSLTDAIQSVVKRIKDTKHFPGTEDGPSYDLATGTSSMDYGYDAQPGMECDLNYKIDSMHGYNTIFVLTNGLSKHITSPDAAEYTFGCGSRAAKPIYKIED